MRQTQKRPLVHLDEDFGSQNFSRQVEAKTSGRQEMFLRIRPDPVFEVERQWADAKLPRPPARLRRVQIRPQHSRLRFKDLPFT